VRGCASDVAPDICVRFDRSDDLRCEDPLTPALSPRSGGEGETMCVTAVTDPAPGPLAPWLTLSQQDGGSRHEHRSLG
jgi:hypothetical protein